MRLDRDSSGFFAQFGRGLRISTEARKWFGKGPEA